MSDSTDDRPWHGTSRKRQEPLYDESVATPTHAERARSLAASRKAGTLSTMSRDLPGYPHGSLVTFAWDAHVPVFLISKLAVHTQNLEAEARCSLLISESGGEDPLALGRLTALGRAHVATEGLQLESSRRAYLETHPDARYYIDFGDFQLWRLDIERIRYIGGFGRMSWVESDAWATAQPDPLREVASGIIDHMNADHADALVAYSRAFTRASAAEKVKMTGVDRYGFEMSVETPEGWRPLRLAFAREVDSSETARKALVELVHAARAQLEAADSK